MRLQPPPSSAACPDRPLPRDALLRAAGDAAVAAGEAGPPTEAGQRRAGRGGEKCLLNFLSPISMVGSRTYASSSRGPLYGLYRMQHRARACTSARPRRHRVGGAWHVRLLCDMCRLAQGPITTGFYRPIDSSRTIHIPSAREMQAPYPSFDKFGDIKRLMSIRSTGNKSRFCQKKIFIKMDVEM